ncbi:MAG: hypothetical protein JXB30_06430 [Anaerolineae bacterium]|nr:hypothetical protein [Anaerolineae bacterium]
MSPEIPMEFIQPPVILIGIIELWAYPEVDTSRCVGKNIEMFFEKDREVFLKRSRSFFVRVPITFCGGIDAA